MPTVKVVHFSKSFVKNYKKRIQINPKLHQKYTSVLKLFLQNPFHPTLKNHKLQGSQRNYRAISIAPDCRLIYFEDTRGYWFIDIGTHKQVYG